MEWTFNRAGQWETTNGFWSALIARTERRDTWVAHVYMAVLPTNRYTRNGFVNVGTAQAWCEAEITRLQSLSHRA
jgi:hypothetical protein